MDLVVTQPEDIRRPVPVLILRFKWDEFQILEGLVVFFLTVNILLIIFAANIQYNLCIIKWFNFGYKEIPSPRSSYVHFKCYSTLQTCAGICNASVTIRQEESFRAVCFKTPLYKLEMKKISSVIGEEQLWKASLVCILNEE